LTVADGETYSERIEVRRGRRNSATDEEERMSALTVAVFLLVQAAPAAAPGTEVRALTVSFLDEKGAEVTDLVPADVALLENGVARDIRSFGAERGKI